MQVRKLDPQVFGQLCGSEGLELLRGLERVPQLRGSAQQLDFALLELSKRKAAISEHEIQALTNVLVRPSDEQQRASLLALQAGANPGEQLVQERRCRNLDTSEIDHNGLMSRHCGKNFLGNDGATLSRRQNAIMASKGYKKWIH